ncbi:MAG: hypothetical protein NC078_04540 [Ruminococcus sp.]|nr:hypothetical protein [Ruminococcus sp.]
MKKNVLAAMAAVMMMVMGGCGSVSGDGTGSADWGGEMTANEDVVSLAESMASSMAESMVESMLDEAGGNVTEEVTEATRAVTTENETEEETDAAYNLWMQRIYVGQYIRTSEEESKTVTIDSEVYPYDSEEIVINIDTEYPYYNDVEPYDCIDLANLKNYPNLKKLNIYGNMYSYSDVRVINWDGAAELENLEEIWLSGVVWGEYDLAKVGSLKTLTIDFCYYDNWDFLGKLKQVEILELSKSGVDELSFINGMDSLTDLTMEHNHSFNNASLDGLEENYSLKRLTFGDNSGFTLNADKELEYMLTDVSGLRKLKGLEQLTVWESGLVDEEKQMNELQEELPACEIKLNGG